MDNQPSLLPTLSGWWHTLKHNEILMFGPQMAFNLMSPTGKTVLIFGEDQKTSLWLAQNESAMPIFHKHENIPSCGKSQKTFTTLYSKLLTLNTCEKMQIILELSEWKRQEIMDLRQTNKILDLVKSYYNMYRYKESCIITLQFSNPDKSNTKLLKYIKILEDMKVNNEQISEKLLEEIYNEIKTTFFIFEKNLNNTVKVLNEKDKEIIRLITNKLISEMDENIEKLRTLTNLKASELLDIVSKCYFIILRTIDIYAILYILTNRDQSSMVYMGVLHSAFIASFLIKHCGYHIIDIGSTVSDFCIKFEDDAFENKYTKLKRFVMNKNEPQKSYLMDIFQDIDSTFT